jgi:hypothetical protein
MNSSPFKCSLFWVSLVVIAAAFWLWDGRLERRHEMRLTRQENRAQRAAQRTSALLFRAFHADNYLTYSALSQTTARMGKAQISSLARVVHAPGRLSIVYVKGDYAGLHSGYNERVAWRQGDASQPMMPYAEMERPAIDMAVRRFALVLQNYRATPEGKTRLAGREAEVIELRPFHPAEGAAGPAKKLWIDAQSGLTLRQQTFNYQMMPVMESVLSEVDLAPRIAADTFVPPQKLREVARQHPWMAHDAGDDVMSVARQTGVYPPQPEANALPAGFAFDSVGAHRCDSCAVGTTDPCYAALSRYTDGLNTLTVFALSPDCAHRKTGAAGASSPEATDAKNDADSNAADNAACDFGTGTLVMRGTEGGQLIAVADLPAPILNRVLQATSIRLYDQGKSEKEKGKN